MHHVKIELRFKHFDAGGACGSRVYLLSGAPVMAHVPLQLRAVGEGVAAVRAAVVVLAGLVPILYVLLQRGVALVAARAVRASVQLGEGIWCACDGEDEGSTVC